jgi:hypothetical protein
LHLIHAFLADKATIHPDNYRTLKEYINPASRFTPTRIPANPYADYQLLESASFDARYKSEMIVSERH